MSNKNESGRCEKHSMLRKPTSAGPAQQLRQQHKKILRTISLIALDFVGANKPRVQGQVTHSNAPKRSMSSTRISGKTRIHELVPAGQSARKFTSRLQNTFRIRITNSDIDRAVTLEGLVKLIQSKLPTPLGPFSVE